MHKWHDPYKRAMPFLIQILIMYNNTLPCAPLHQSSQGFRQRQNQKSHNKIIYAMYYIVRESRGYPSQCLLPTKAVHESLPRCVQHAKHNSVQRANKRINHARHFFGHIFGQEHGHSPKYCPNIQIRQPPHCKARK